MLVGCVAGGLTVLERACRERMKEQGVVNSSKLDQAAKEAEGKRKEKRAKVDSMLAGVPKALHGMYRNALQKMV